MMRWRQRVQVCLAAAVMIGFASAARAQEQAPAPAPAPATATESVEGGKLKVTVEYKGTGTVDAEHRIWVWLFDNPDITADSMPLAVGVLKENKASYKFVALPKQVYIAAAFDTQGGYDGASGPPPTGTPITLHGSTGMGVPAAPIATGGEDAVVTVMFDDTMKMP